MFKCYEPQCKHIGAWLIETITTMPFTLNFDLESRNLEHRLSFTTVFYRTKLGTFVFLFNTYS